MSCRLCQQIRQTTSWTLSLLIQYEDHRHQTGHAEPVVCVVRVDELARLVRGDQRNSTAQAVQAMLNDSPSEEPYRCTDPQCGPACRIKVHRSIEPLSEPPKMPDWMEACTVGMCRDGEAHCKTCKQHQSVRNQHCSNQYCKSVDNV